MQTTDHPTPVDAQLDEIMRRAFYSGRAPRSAPYKDGARALLRARLTNGTFNFPADMVLGTAEADAFFAGVDEGRHLWSEQFALQQIQTIKQQIPTTNHQEI
ncbi:hypothetical protein [Rugamonas sp. DEMB1]|uniref:hypothetical protein n=1 Tax=Rugamonas sp. DEMB1 TaxID=3039386 RepID=UPI00244AAED0|nr:hypothetical protein [Rugamonas sp. DEMB1]WGG51804.1 hypothetical protein QC826_06175 [Rugamonas sp. DEMB1]